LKAARLAQEAKGLGVKGQGAKVKTR